MMNGKNSGEGLQLQAWASGLCRGEGGVAGKVAAAGRYGQVALNLTGYVKECFKL